LSALRPSNLDVGGFDLVAFPCGVLCPCRPWFSQHTLALQDFFHPSS
jgi:hypothetical protein